MDIMIKLKTIAICASLTLSTLANAAVVSEFNDVTSFNSALVGGASTSENFDAFTESAFTAGEELIFDGFGITFDNSFNSNQTAGIFSAATVNSGFGSAINSTNSVAFGESGNLPFADGSTNGTGDGPVLTFRFFAPITAFAFDFSDSDPSDSYSVQIDDATPFQLDIDSNLSTFISFFGFVSDTAFTTITFRQTTIGGGFTEAFSIDNILTNGFSTQAEADAAVPAPGIISLLVMSLGGILIARRKRQL